VPKNTQLSNAAVNIQADALASLLDDGYLRLFTAPQPISADVPLDSQVMLAQLRFNATAASKSANGIAKFQSIASAAASSTGTAAWFRAYKSDGITAVLDGTVDVASNGPNLAVNTTHIALGAKVAVANFIHTVPKA
jgi:hypothetical protein